jgi:hypothetical protein
MKKLAVVLALMVAPSCASAGLLLNTTGNTDGRDGLLESPSVLNDQFQRMPEIPTGRGPLTSCSVEGIKTKCWRLDHSFVAERAIPVMPGRLFRTIQTGNPEPRASFEYDRASFWSAIRKFRFNGPLALVNPIAHGGRTAEGAQLEEEVVWVDIERDSDAREVGRIWEEIASILG